MKTVVLLLLLVHDAAAVSHSLNYFETASSGVPNFPEYVAVSLVDGVEVMRYDSNTRRIEPKQDWMDKATANDPHIWESETQRSRMNQELLKVRIETAKWRFNHTGGGHMFQWMYGCEWDDETGETDAFWQNAYDGGDFFSLDLKTMTCVAAKPQAVYVKHKLDNDRGWLAFNRYFFNHTCIELLKKHLDAGKSSLLRTERPSVSFLQRTPSSPVRCFATGFFPNRALIFWRKDGGELHEGVEMGALLPNHDGTFQISADLTLPEDATDLHKYECVFKLSGLKDDLVYRLDTHPIKTNHRNPTDTATIIIVAMVILALILLAFSAFMLYKKKKAPGPPPASDSSSALSEKLHPVS